MKKRVDCGGARAAFCRERQEPPGRFDKRSFRTVKRGKARIVVGCPKGHYHPRRRRSRRCDVGLRAQTILRPMSSPACASCRLR